MDHAAADGLGRDVQADHGPVDDSADALQTPVDARVRMTDVELTALESLIGTTSPRRGRLTMDVALKGKLAEAMKGCDVVINLACISNDASFELDENLSTTINLDAFEPMVIAAVGCLTRYESGNAPKPVRTSLTASLTMSPQTLFTRLT